MKAYKRSAKMRETMWRVSRYATYLHVEHSRLRGRLQIEALADLEKSYTNKSTHCTSHKPHVLFKAAFSCPAQASHGVFKESSRTVEAKEFIVGRLRSESLSGLLRLEKFGGLWVRHDDLSFSVCWI